LCFYRRLDAKRLCRGMNYTTPSLNGEGEHELDILFFNFGSNTLDHKEKQRIVSDVYTRFYNLPLTDPLVSRVLSGVTACAHPKCEEEAPTDTGVDPCVHAIPKPDSTAAATAQDATTVGDASPAAEVAK